MAATPRPPTQRNWEIEENIMLYKTKKAMEEYAATLPPSTDRAQCYTIANYGLNVGETIAERILRDHANDSQACRAMQLMVDAGCATSDAKDQFSYGTFTFEDDSQF